MTHLLKRIIPLTAAFAIFLGSTAQLAARSVDRELSSFQVKEASIEEALKELILQTERTIILGFERAPAGAAPRMTLQVEHSTVGEILRQICLHDSRYTFAETADGVVEVYPVTQAVEPSALMNLPIASVDLKVQEWPANIISNIFRFLPELSAYLDARAREYQMRTSGWPPGSPGIRMSTDAIPPLVELRLKNTTVRGVLNALAAYTVNHVAHDESGNRLYEPTGWEFWFEVNERASTGLGGYPHWRPFP